MFASCPQEPHSLTELLLFDSRDRIIFLGEIKRTAKYLDNSYFSEVKVEEVFKGNLESKIVTIETGGTTTAGGFPLEFRSKWVFFGRKYENNVFGATVCDWMSCNEKTLPEKYYNTLQIVSSFKKMTESQYSGDVIWYFPNGTKAAEGKFRKGKAHGRWKHYYENGDLRSEMKYKNGVLHGGIFEIDEFKREQSIAFYKKGVLISKERVFAPNYGEISKKKYKLLQRKGNFQLYNFQSSFQNGNIYIDQTRWSTDNVDLKWYDINIKDGYFVEKDSFGTIRNQGYYFKGAKIGKWIETPYQNSKTDTVIYQKPKIPAFDFYFFDEKGFVKVQGNLKNNVPNGTWQYYSWRNVLYKEIEFKEGVQIGLERNNQGQILDHYENDKKNGESFTYFENGSIKSQVNYENDIKSGFEIIYHEPDAIQSKGNYINGKLHGDYISFDAQGDTLLIGTFKQGALQGNAIEYDRDSKTQKCLKKMGEYKDGFKDGEWKIFNCDGKFLQICQYKRGDLEYDPRKPKTAIEESRCD
jgi:antitoxin component YwqK of YwqJK toxin-antitoxin module